jgi:hypothetical protein
MIIESGIIIFCGFAFLFWKLPRITLLRLLKYGLWLDLAGAVAGYVLHWGTFSGVMAAAVAGLLLSGMTTAAKWLVGYIDGRTYYPGVINYLK